MNVTRPTIHETERRVVDKRRKEVRYKRLYSLNLSMGSYVRVKSEMTGKYEVYLLDTGASISIIKVNALAYSTRILQSDCKISGVAEGLVPTIGFVNSKLYFGNSYLTHKFFVVGENFPIPCDGILGLDFLEKYNSSLHYGKEWKLFLRPSFNRTIEIRVHETPDGCSMVIPSRCEVIREVDISPGKGDVYVPNQQIADGVFVGRTIVSREKAFVRVLNVNDKDIILKNVYVTSESLSNYDLYDTPKSNVSVRTEILQKLQRNFPKFAYDDLTKLCSDYLDVFALESDPATFNNFYKQKLHLKDNVPVYIKNYRIPHTHP